jgi:hypothetical protein
MVNSDRARFNPFGFTAQLKKTFSFLASVSLWFANQTRHA